MRVPLTGGSYTARSVIAGAQRCLNLYPETGPSSSEEPATVAHYPTPGLRLLATMPQGPVRGIYQASGGNVYVVAGQLVYLLDGAFHPTVLGVLSSAGTTPVSMADNGNTLVIVDGTANGWTVDLMHNTFAAIADTVFQGADRVDYLDTFLLFNVPNTPQFQSSDSLAVTFDPLYFANKSAHADNIVSIAVAKREIWLIGQLTTEVWYNTGAADFPFQAMPGAFIDHGCIAKYSVAQADDAVFWLSQERQGFGIVLMGSGYQAKRISTHAIEQEISAGVLTDAVGFCYQQAGHAFYVLTFPTTDLTYVYDVATGLWHQRSWGDATGQHRIRANCHGFARGVNIVGDWQTGALYALDPAAYDDAGAPITRQRAFPHMMADGKRVTYQQFIADMECGNLGSATAAVLLDWSDDRGATFGATLAQSLTGTLTSLQWRRLGMARDRVFRLTWSAPVHTALQGAFIESRPSAS